MQFFPFQRLREPLERHRLDLFLWNLSDASVQQSFIKASILTGWLRVQTSDFHSLVNFSVFPISPFGDTHTPRLVGNGNHLGQMDDGCNIWQHHTFYLPPAASFPFSVLHGPLSQIPIRTGNKLSPLFRSDSQGPAQHRGKGFY